MEDREGLENGAKIRLYELNDNRLPRWSCQRLERFSRWVRNPKLGEQLGVFRRRRQKFETSVSS